MNDGANDGRKACEKRGGVREEGGEERTSYIIVKRPIYGKGMTVAVPWMIMTRQVHEYLHSKKQCNMLMT